MLWALGAVAVVVVLWVVSRSRTYSAIFSDAHFAELAAAAPRLKAAALEKLDAEPTGPDDPRAFVSSAGLAVFYTVRPEGDRFVHHCSVSLTQGYTPRAVGGRFIVECMRLFGMPPEQTMIEVAPSTVHHAEAVLGAASAVS